MWNDAQQHVRSYHECRIKSTYKGKIPATILASLTIFSCICVDVMYMPGMRKGSNPKYIVIAKDDLTGASKGRALVSIASGDLAAFFWEEIFC